MDLSELKTIIPELIQKSWIAELNYSVKEDEIEQKCLARIFRYFLTHEGSRWSNTFSSVEFDDQEGTETDLLAVSTDPSQPKPWGIICVDELNTDDLSSMTPPPTDRFSRVALISASEISPQVREAFLSVPYYNEYIDVFDNMWRTKSGSPWDWKDAVLDLNQYLLDLNQEAVRNLYDQSLHLLKNAGFETDVASPNYHETLSQIGLDPDDLRVDNVLKFYRLATQYSKEYGPKQLIIAEIEQIIAENEVNEEVTQSQLGNLTLSELTELKTFLLERQQEKEREREEAERKAQQELEDKERQDADYRAKLRTELENRKLREAKKQSKADRRSRAKAERAKRSVARRPYNRFNSWNSTHPVARLGKALSIGSLVALVVGIVIIGFNIGSPEVETIDVESLPAVIIPTIDINDLLIQIEDLQKSKIQSGEPPQDTYTNPDANISDSFTAGVVLPTIEIGNEIWLVPDDTNQIDSSPIEVIKIQGTAWKDDSVSPPIPVADGYPIGIEINGREWDWVKTDSFGYYQFRILVSDLETQEPDAEHYHVRFLVGNNYGLWGKNLSRDHMGLSKNSLQEEYNEDLRIDHGNPSPYYVDIPESLSEVILTATPYPTPTARPTATPYPTVRPTVTPYPTPTPDYSCVGQPAGLVCICKSGAWRDCSLPTSTPYPTAVHLDLEGWTMVNPAASHIGDFVSISGSKFLPNAYVYHYYSSFGEKILLGSTLTDEYGGFSDQIRIPMQVKQGSSNIIISESEGVTGRITHAVRSTKLNVSSRIGVVGGELTITGSGFKPDQLVTALYVGNISATPSPMPRTDEYGELLIVITIPRGVPPGHSLIQVKIDGEPHYGYIKIRE